MITFRDGFYADIRTEDRSRTIISYKAGILEEMRTRVEQQAFLRVYDGRLWYYASVTDLKHLQETLNGLYAAATANPAIQEESSALRRDNQRHQPGCGCCQVNKMKELTEQAVVYMNVRCGKMSGVMHMVRTFHAVDGGTRHFLVAMYPRQQLHRNK